jgi:hypothetical protein
MTDPLSVAASAVQTLGSAAAASYAKGRDERRQVYRRFQEATVAYVMQIRDSRLSPEAMGLAPDQRKPYIDALMKATTELAQALYEVRLVGNPGVVEAAEAVRQAISDSFDAAAARRESLTADESRKYAEAMQAFTTACRIDLRYQPRWWQIWRGGWWRTRRDQMRTRREGPAATNGLAPPAAQVNSASSYDVAFGVATDPRARIVYGGPTNSGLMIVGTVVDGFAANPIDARNTRDLVSPQESAGTENPAEDG